MHFFNENQGPWGVEKRGRANAKKSENVGGAKKKGYDRGKKELEVGSKESTWHKKIGEGKKRGGGPRGQLGKAKIPSKKNRTT